MTYKMIGKVSMPFKTYANDTEKESTTDSILYKALTISRREGTENFYWGKPRNIGELVQREEDLWGVKKESIFHKPQNLWNTLSKHFMYREWGVYIECYETTQSE